MEIFKYAYKYKNTFCELLSGVINEHIYITKVRKYNSCLEYALYDDHIKPDFYKNLIKYARNNVNILHKYVSLKKKILGVDKLYLYDLYFPLINYKGKTEYTFDEAADITIDSVKYLGKEYQTIFSDGIKKNRWIDKYENKGKKGGAYSSGCYKTKPYILLNFNGTLYSVFTLAHEMGHSLHTYFSSKNCNPQDFEYTIFVAEVASTLNECNLRYKLLKESKSSEEKLYIMYTFLEQIRTTFFRQIMFADFEMQIHEMMENNEQLSPELLCKIYNDLNRFYYGEDLEIDELSGIEWARVPHFYLNFYVYKYSIGLIAANYLADKIRKGNEIDLNNYIKFLSSGRKKSPIELLKIAGVDLTKTDPIDKLMESFKITLDEFKKKITIISDITNSSFYHKNDFYIYKNIKKRYE